MKKIALIIIVLLTLSTITNAQKWSYGVRLGVNSSYLVIPVEGRGFVNDLDGESKSGIVIGGFAEYKVKFIGFTTELQYSEQGSKFYLNPEKNGIANRQIDLNYISLSPILKFYLCNWLNIQLGWHSDYNMFGNNYLTTVYHDSNQYKDYFYHYKLNKWSNGVLAGMEASIDDHISLAFRTYPNNSNIMDRDKDFNDVYNHVSQFSIAYKF